MGRNTWLATDSDSVFEIGGEGPMTAKMASRRWPTMVTPAAHATSGGGSAEHEDDMDSKGSMGDNDGIDGEGNKGSTEDDDGKSGKRSQGEDDDDDDGTGGEGSKGDARDACWIPRTPGSKSISRTGREHPRTMPRLTSSSSPMLHRQQSQGRSLVSPATGDRFIPNRGNMNMDLCRASVLSAEKRRLESIGKAAVRARRRRLDQLHDAAEESSAQPQVPSQDEPESRLQTEFHRRMKAL